MSKSFFILTTHGEVGPVDRDGMRDLLREGRIQRGDQVRNAFGRMLGTVADQLGRQSGAQPAATASDRHSAPFTAQSSGRRPAVRSELNPRMVMLSAMAGLVLIGGTVAFLAARSSPASTPTPIPQSSSQPPPPTASPPVVPTPVPSPVKAVAAPPPPAAPAETPRPPVGQQPDATIPVADAASEEQATICLSVDDVWTAYLNGVKVGTGSNLRNASVAKNVPVQRGTNVLAVIAHNNKRNAGLIFDIRIGARRIVSGPEVRFQVEKPPAEWMTLAFDDSAWNPTVVIEAYGKSIWGRKITGIPSDTQASWVWSHGGRQKEDQTIYCRFTFEHPEPTAK